MISIIGNGFVGGAVAYGFSQFQPKVYDVDPQRSQCSLDEALAQACIFVCLPTPMVSVEGGKANLSILRGFFKSIESRTVDGVFVVKSTVPVGTTKQLQKTFPQFKFVHNPEFLTAANAKNDFVNADRTVIGSSDISALQTVLELYQSQFPDIPIYVMTSDESELVKYTANCFLAVKTMFFNEIKLLSESFDADYLKIVAGVTADRRIGVSHTRVPGPDGDYGFGGTCFPKDINALIHTIDTMEHNQKKLPNSDILKAVWERNKQVRDNWDWATSKSAVVSEEKTNG